MRYKNVCYFFEKKNNNNKSLQVRDDKKLYGSPFYDRCNKKI